MPAPVNHKYDEVKARQAVAEAIEAFYASLLAVVDDIDINKVLKTKNPYLYRVKNLKTAQEIVNSILDAYISSSEETIFGNLFFEPLAIAVSGGRKSTSEGVDLEIDTETTRTIIAVKSGTSIYNADSKNKQKQNFERAGKLARQGGLALTSVIGYAYGTKKPTAGSFAEELAGEDFWEYITGDPMFYKKIIQYMGTTPETYAKKFEESRARAFNRMVKGFSEDFVEPDGSINWDKIVDYNSGSRARKEREEFQRIKAEVMRLIADDVLISKVNLRRSIGCSEKRLNDAVEELLAEGRIARGRNGGSSKKGWTIL